MVLYRLAISAGDPRPTGVTHASRAGAVQGVLYIRVHMVCWPFQQLQPKYETTTLGQRSGAALISDIAYYPRGAGGRRRGDRRRH